VHLDNLHVNRALDLLASHFVLLKHAVQRAGLTVAEPRGVALHLLLPECTGARAGLRVRHGAGVVVVLEPSVTLARGQVVLL